MQRIIGTILSLSLLLGLSAERLIPCVEGSDLCGDVAASSSEDAHDVDHHHEDGSTGDHHDGCNDCSCPCHAPLLPALDRSPDISGSYVDYGSASIHLIPSLALSPPGPIPLG